jgi:GT2 family glycosyltransferase
LPPTVTVVVPTLAGDARLLECLASLERQTMSGVQVVVVDNSGCGAIHRLGAGGHRFRLIENGKNAGFGAAINQGFRLAPADYLATLNDDAVAGERWLEASVGEMERRAEVGMVAPQIVLCGTGRLDSAGMLMGRDGSSKQRGQGEAAAGYGAREEVLLPSGCAAVYRSAMLREIGLFAEDFFLYCEDTDLGLRGRWAGWRCAYVPEARVEHGYSQSAGRASERKAWLVERNRVRVAVRCLPASWLWMSPAWTAARYFWHGALMLGGKGKAAEYRESGGSAWRLAALVVKAHADAVRRMPQLLRERGEIRRTRRVSSREFVKLLRRHAITARQVAAQ